MSEKKPEPVDGQHSALDKGMVEIEGEIQMHQSDDGCYAFEYDIFEGVHDYFKKADVIYTAPAWRHGYEKFYERIGKEIPPERTYQRYLQVTEKVVKELDIPAFLMGGTHYLNYIQPDNAYPIKFRNKDIYMMVYGDVDYPKGPKKTIFELAEILAEREEYEVYLDFFCGYGKFVEVFYEHGNSFVASDFNPKCIYKLVEDIFGKEEARQSQKKG